MTVRADKLSDELISILVRKGTVWVFVELKYGPKFLEECVMMAEGSWHMRAIINHIKAYPGTRFWVDVGYTSDSRLVASLSDLERILEGFIKIWGEAEHPDYYGEYPSAIIFQGGNVSKQEQEDYAIMSDFTYNPAGTFAYNINGGELRFINLSLNDAQSWDCRYDYTRNAFVQRGTTYWIALVSNTGIDPLTQGQVAWSPLIPTKVGPSRGPQGPQGPIGGANNNQVINIGGRPCTGGNDPGLPNGEALKITSFSVSPASIQMGETGARLLTFAWSLNGTPFNQVVNPGNNKIPNTERSLTTSFNLVTTTTFKLEVWGSGTEDYDSAEVTIPMTNLRYWGTSSSDTLTAAQIRSELQSESAPDIKFSKPVSPSGEYIYIAYPVRLGMGAMYVGGFYNTAWEQTVVNVTNSVGFTEAYNVFRSTYAQNGSNIIVEIK